MLVIQGGETYGRKKIWCIYSRMSKRKKMTQTDLAIKLNVTDKAVSRWERVMKSKRIITEEATGKDTLKQEQQIAMMRILLTLFAGTNILYTIGKGDHILQTICIVCILIIAVITSVTMLKNKEINPIKQSIIQMLYCGLTVWISFGLSQFAGNILASILVIAITVVYIRFLKY